MVVSPEGEHGHLLLLDLGVVTFPRDQVVLVLLVEGHLCMHVVLNHLLAAAVCQVVDPLLINCLTLDVVVEEWVVTNHVRRSLVNVEAREPRDQHNSNNCIQSRHHNRTFSKFKVPNLNIIQVSKSIGISVLTYFFLKVVWQSKALLLADSVQTSRASVHCVHCQQVRDGQDDEGKEAEDDHRDQGSETKEGVYFVFDIGHHLD